MMDLVRYKLQRLDERNAGLRGLLGRHLESLPLAFCAVGLISGIVIQQYAAPGRVVWLVALAVAMVGGVTAAVALEKPGRPAAVALAAAVAFTCLGGIRIEHATQPDPRSISALIPADGSIADLRGRVASDVHIEDRTSWQFGQFVRGDLASGFDLELSQAKCVDGWQDVTGTLRVVVAEPVYDLKAGQSMQMYAFVKAIHGPDNPGGFDARAFYARLGVCGAAFVDGRSAIEDWAGNQPQGIFSRFQQWLRDAAGRKLRWGRSERDESDGLLDAFLMGTRSDITPQTYEAFRRTGLLHYVSLSGMNIAIVIAAVWQFARIAGITRRRRAVLCIAGIILFLILVPMQSPILRAGIIGIAFCASALLRRQTQPLNTLSLAAILILLVSPQDLSSVGWQLSFGCVVGILLFTRRLEFAFHETVSRIVRRNIVTEDIAPRAAGWLMESIVTVMAVGIAAWLGGGGLMLYHFYNITPLASIWTAITSPLMTAITVLGYIKMIVSAILPTAGGLLAPVMSWLSWAFIWAVTLMARVRWSEIVIGHVPVWLVAAFYVAILYIPLVHWPRPHLKRMVGLALAMVFIVGLAGIKWQRMHPSQAEFTVLSVGHGQAAVARLPGGSFLFDCGSMTMKDCGRKTVLPFFRWEGMGRLDAAFLSHTDVDHCNGIGEVAAACQPRNIFLPAPMEADLRDYGQDAVLKRSIGSMSHAVLAGQAMECGTARITTLWPPADAEAIAATSNDKSMVSLIEFGGRRVLIASDIQQPAQKEILARYPNLKADVIIAPHHGSAKSLYKGFYSRLDPNVVVFSCDQVQQQRAQHAVQTPTAVQTFYTPRDGAITIRIGADSSLSIETYLVGHP
jgi:competence protein ComEC